MPKPKTFKALYLKRTGGGAVVCFTEKLILFGGFDIKMKLKTERQMWEEKEVEDPNTKRKVKAWFPIKGKIEIKEKAQNQGDCATLVENCAKYVVGKLNS